MDEKLEEFSEFVHEQIRSKNLSQVKAELEKLNPAEVIYVLQQCLDADKPVVFRLLPKDKAVDVFDLMDVVMQSELLDSFTNEETVSFLKELDPDDQVRLLDELPAKVAKHLLNALPRAQRITASRLMGYDDDTVGRIMSPVHASVQLGMTASAALTRLREKKGSSDDVINTVYVTDATRTLQGTLPLSSLVLADPETRIGDLLQEGPVAKLYTENDQEEGARLLQKLDVVELPVLDSEERLVGVLTVDDAMDIIQEEVTDDMFDKVGLLDVTRRETDRSNRMVSGNFLHVLAVRVPFLLITLVGGMMAGVVIDGFEKTLEAVVATAIFIPVIMDMGGNVGTQSSTIFTRGLVLGHINVNHFFHQWIRQLLYGGGMGLFLGTLGGVIATLWQGIPILGLAVGVSLALTVTLAVGLGFLVPYVLVKMGLDQAAGADPIITTIKDITGLLIYFSSVKIFVEPAIAAL